VAEQARLRAVTTGAANDLQRVGGDRPRDGPRVRHGLGGSTARAVTDANVVSDATRRIRDEEQQDLVFEAERGARRLVGEHRGKLEEIARALLEHEVIDRAQLDAIMGGVPRLRRSAGESGLRVVAAEGRAPDGPSTA
jgi:cell division protease FtsH